MDVSLSQTFTASCHGRQVKYIAFCDKMMKMTGGDGHGADWALKYRMPQAQAHGPAKTSAKTPDIAKEQTLERAMNLKSFEQ